MPPHRTRRRCYIAPSAAPRDPPLAVSSFSSRCQCAVAPDGGPLAPGCPGTGYLCIYPIPSSRPPGRGPKPEGRVGSRGGCGWPRPAKGGPAGPGAHLAVDNDRPPGSQAHASGGAGGELEPAAGGLSKSGIRRGLSSPEATSNHHQDPEGDTKLTRLWPVVHARGGLRAKAGLSLHRVSAVRRNGFQK
jgi:hypothetical protein